MKIKIFGIIVLMLLITSAITVVGNTNIKQKQNIGYALLDDDVPVWNVGDSWTYTVDDFTFDYEAEGTKIYFDGEIDDFTWTVAGTSGSVYTVDFTGKLNCVYEIFMSSSGGNIYLVGSMKNTLTRMDGTLVFTKSDLQLKDMTAEIKGITFVKISPLPIALPIPFKATIDVDLSTDFPLFNFPLSSNKFWDLPNMDLVMKMNVGGIFGLIRMPVTFTTGYYWTPLAFHCKNKQSVSVEAGTFDAWEIESTFFDLFRYYYAPEVGNIIKIDATMPNGDVHGELKSTNYV
jgi:hypothetical protein